MAIGKRTSHLEEVNPGGRAHPHLLSVPGLSAGQRLARSMFGATVIGPEDSAIGNTYRDGTVAYGHPVGALRRRISTTAWSVAEELTMLGSRVETQPPFIQVWPSFSPGGSGGFDQTPILSYRRW